MTSYSRKFAKIFKWKQSTERIVAPGSGSVGSEGESGLDAFSKLAPGSDVYKIAFLEQILTVFCSKMRILTVF